MTWAWNAIEKLDWPVLTLEVRRFRRSKGLLMWLVPAAAVLGLAGFLIHLATGFRSSGEAGIFTSDPSLYADVLNMILAVLQVALVYLVVPIYASRVVSLEREAGTLEALTMTPLSSQSIVTQKIALPLMVPLVVALVSLPAAVASHFSGSWFASMVPVASVVDAPFTAALYASVGAFCSCLCSNSRASAIVTIAVAWVVVPAVLAIPRAIVMSPPDLGSGLMDRIVLAVVLTPVLICFSAARLDRLRRAA